MFDEEITEIFTYHRPFGNQAERYEALRECGRVLAMLIQRACPESREKSLAITSIQQSIMWANASIACHEFTDGPLPE